MHELKNGKYRITLATPSAPPPYPVGANEDGGPTNPVISDGKHKVWTAERLPDGNYYLILEPHVGPRWLSQAGEEEVFVSIMPLPGQWKIQHHEEHRYSIEVPSERWPTKAWTLDDTVPGTKVRLGVYELPRPGQLWNFIPHEED